MHRLFPGDLPHRSRLHLTCKPSLCLSNPIIYHSRTMECRDGLLSHGRRPDLSVRDPPSIEPLQVRVFSVRSLHTEYNRAEEHK